MSVDRPQPEISLSGALVNGFVVPIAGIIALLLFSEGAFGVSILLGMAAIILVLLQRVYAVLRSIEASLDERPSTPAAGDNSE